MADMGSPSENIQEISNFFERIIKSLPEVLGNILIGILLLVIGYIVGAVLGHFVKRILQKVGLDKKMEKERLSDSIGKLPLSHILGKITKWYIFIIFVGQAAEIIELNQFSGLVEKFVLWIPELLFGIVIIIVGLILAEYIANHLKETKIRSVRVLSQVIKVLIIFFVLVIALTQIGLNVIIVGNTFLVILGSICLALALAIGIGFGLALKDEARSIIKNLRKEVK